MTAKHVCPALNVRGNRRQNRRDPSLFVRVAVIAVSISRAHRNSEARIVLHLSSARCLRCLARNREPGGEVPSNPCHRDKSYGNSNKNWNKNDPVSPLKRGYRSLLSRKSKFYRQPNIVSL